MTNFRANPLKHLKEQTDEILLILREIKMKPEGDFLVGNKAASEFLGVCRATLNRYVKDGKIKFVQTPGENKFWNKDLIEFLNNRKK